MASRYREGKGVCSVRRRESPSENAAPNSPVAVAWASVPIAMAMLVRLLWQFALLPIPKNDAQVAFAVGAPVSVPAASAPDTNAPSRTPP